MMSIGHKRNAVNLLVEYCHQFEYGTCPISKEKGAKYCLFECPIINSIHMLQKEIYLENINIRPYNERDFNEEQSLDKDNGQLDDDNGNNDNLELVNRLRSFCEQYDGVSCVVCPIFSKNEAYCPLNLMVKRLSDCL